MPYITKEMRPEMDQLLEPLIEHIKTLPLEKQDGALNYAVTKMLKHLYPQSYFHYNRALGALSAITQEFYRKVVAPYEDTKIAENGEVE